jgi:hypothetical protein
LLFFFAFVFLEKKKTNKLYFIEKTAIKAKGILDLFKMPVGIDPK